MPEQTTITLESPIKRGESTITSVSVRKPQAGELRNLTLSNLLSMDVNSLVKVLPRITTPALTEHDVQNMDPADLLQFGTEVSDFLLPKHLRQPQQESPSQQ